MDEELPEGLAPVLVEDHPLIEDPEMLLCENCGAEISPIIVDGELLTLCPFCQTEVESDG